MEEYELGLSSSARSSNNFLCLLRGRERGSKSEELKNVLG